MEYSILNANLVLTKCFDIKLYLIQVSITDVRNQSESESVCLD